MPEPAQGERDGQPGSAGYQPLVIVLVAAAAGMVADRYRPMPVGLWWAAAAAAWALWWVFWLGRRQVVAGLLLLVSVAALAGSWHHCRWHLFAADDLGRFAGRRDAPVCLEAVVLETPQESPPAEADPLRMFAAGESTRLSVAPVAVRDGTAWRSASGCSRLSVYGEGAFEDVRVGDRLRIFAQMALPEPAQNPGEYDYARFLRGHRTLSDLRCNYAECASVCEAGSPWSLARWLEGVRLHGQRLLARHLDPRRVPLAAAVLLGQREGFDQERTQAFVETGTVHLLAISGLHVGILAAVWMFVALRLPVRRGWALLAVAALVAFYMLLVEARPPVVRATVLILVCCAALWLRRRPLSFNSLAAAGLVVLAINPAELFQPGAQLSFLAVAGLMWFAPRWTRLSQVRDPLQRLVSESRSWPNRAARAGARFFAQLALVSLTIWLLTLPLVMARFHLLTPAAAGLNTVIWVPTVLGLWSGFATLVLGPLWSVAGNWCGSLCDLSLWLVEAAVLAARRVPASHFWVPGPPEWWLAGFYGGLGLAAALPRCRPSRRWCAAILAGWMAVGLGGAAWRGGQDRLQCTFLSMGHGCAVVVELPDGQTLLYDAGRLGSPRVAGRSVAAALWSRGITHVEAVVLSHGDADHYNALPELMEKFSVGVVYVSPVMFADRSPALESLHRAIAAREIPIREIQAGDRLVGGPGCRIEVLHPPRHGVLGRDNANSLTLAVEYRGRRILLTGDLESPGLDDLLAEEPLDCDVLLVPHHGSAQSNVPALAAWSTPEQVVISGSHRWDSRPVEAAYAAAGARVLHTADAGAVTVRIDQGGAIESEVFLPVGGNGR